MSWTQSYTHTLAIGVDRFGAAVLYNQPDITISSLCWLERTSRGLGAPAPSPVQTRLAQNAVRQMRLYAWQATTLKWIGAGLERLSSGHCARAMASDLNSLDRVEKLLGADHGPTK